MAAFLRKVLSCVPIFVWFLWMLPQTILAMVYLLFLFVKNNDGVKVSFHGNTFIVSSPESVGGVCLGVFIFIRNLNFNVIMHEFGHTLQSVLLGPLYLLVVGIPSLVFNRISVHKGYGSVFAKNYYNRFPENWADKLGEVKRDLP